ncbi:HD domain-containing protein [Glycomyces albidus]|uniref:HD domain-containing protein n=1 Tax=Glycomyces albidus TaxID=2656774 RepID=A0A6L5GFE5_9ACTN|nr:HD domain-containing protein [Glycomyces albidus]MQM28305.1 HD domain-containing protein [Glycomyces albidus]
MQTGVVNVARALAERELSESLPRRWRHVTAVAAKAERLAPLLPAECDRHALVAAAVLHDVGYAPSVAETGFHPLDGARWLRSIEFDGRVAALVAHHTNAVVEAELRGLDAVLLAEFDQEDSPVTDLLWFCDLTTGPDGQEFSGHERIEEIRQRYEPGSVVRQFIDRSVGTFHEVAKRVGAQFPPVQPM